MSSSPLPEGYSPPTTIVTEFDHSGWLTVATGLGLCVVLLFYAIKLYILTEFSLPHRRDDAVLALATVLFIVQASVTFVQVDRGFGKSIDLISSSNLVAAQKLNYAGDILYLFDLFLSKCVVILFCIRLTPDKTHTRLLYGLLGFSALWMIASIFIVALKCNLSHPWLQYNVQCSGLYTRWAFIAVVDIVIEVCIFVAVVLLVRDLQMTLKKKMTVATVFAFRLPLIVLAILRLHYIRHGVLTNNSTLHGVPAAVLTEVELSYSIISATIPCLNPFMKALSTNYGAMGPGTVIGGSQLSGTHKSSSGKQNGSYDLKTMKSQGTMKSVDNHVEPKRTSVTRKKSASDIPDVETHIYRGDHAKSVVEAHAVSGGQHLDSESVGSNDSTRRIIRMKFEWSVASEASSHGDNGDGSHGESSSHGGNSH